MQISLLDSLSRKISVTAIAGYQRHISPHKGFQCAHRVLYGGDSCSQFIKRTIAQEGLKVAFTQSRRRFQACKQANLILKSQAEELEPPTETEEDTQTTQPQPIAPKSSCQDSFDAVDLGINCADLSCDCSELLNMTPDCGFLDCGATDCGALDCSSLDCSGLDCSFIDCGGCSW
ncbi:membrane protein insertion efficiency factor YidD [Sphaerospermopsis aphanizomenoides BCCUSP55]|uniref:membrane protein insertion efficiency factor YidD n=1 Tax=Sphaerospermopsis aphanizomenoides TaxID=459663 RepID=UPI001908CC9A|nr:membrane protein insertion efficiency factor YidD [Sphaerospermopsis aphanizomenoides]MBK1988128.1 membrane protein insertion efficiency factor YidD [Sphaerospermopsis aphanizomenoides BCCUSP55]